jgi:hypothetical protein
LASGPRPERIAERRAELGHGLPPIRWRHLRRPVAVSLFGGVVFYALIVELSYVLDGLGVTSPATIGQASTAVGAGHGTGLWTGSLFIGQFLCPILLLAVGRVAGGLTTALDALGVASLAITLALLTVLRPASAITAPPALKGVRPRPASPPGQAVATRFGHCPRAFASASVGARRAAESG